MLHVTVPIRLEEYETPCADMEQKRPGCTHILAKQAEGLFAYMRVVSEVYFWLFELPVQTLVARAR